MDCLAAQSIIVAAHCLVLLIPAPNNQHSNHPAINMPVTEVGCMVVKPDVDLTDEHSPGAQILARAWTAATSEPTGPYRLYWGLEVENPCNLWG